MITFVGADAVVFAHAQLASEVASLAEGRWHWTCLLSAQGRVLGFGPLLRVAGDSLWWVVPAVQAESLAAALRRYVLRRRVVIGVAKPVIEGRAGAMHSAVPHAGGAAAHDRDTVVVEIGGLAGRRLCIGGAPTAGTEAASAWHALDALDALPRLQGAAVEAFTAHALGLQRIGAFSTSKGCYPGQEIVARTHFLGRNKREPRIGWLPADAVPPEPGSRWLAPGAAADAEALADTVTAAVTGDGVSVLVVAREDAPPTLVDAASGRQADFDVAARNGIGAAKML